MTAPRPVYFPDPVSDRVSLYDRVGSLTEVLDSLRHRSTVIRGARLMGKTSLLNIVALAFEDDGQYAMIRLAPADSRLAFMAEILDGIEQWVEEHRSGPTRLAVASRGRTAASGFRSRRHAQTEPDQHPLGTVAQFCQRIARLAELASGVVFVLCVDEFDSLIQDWDEHEARVVLELIAHLDAMPKLPIRFLLTMSTIPALALTSYRSPMLNQAKIVTLNPWDDDEAHSFARWLADGRFTFDDEALATLFAAAGGHPYFTKAVLNALLTGPLGGPTSGQVTAAQVADAVRQAARSPEVDVALENLIRVHLSPDAVAILDHAGNSSAGISGRTLADHEPSGHLLTSLQADGLLRRHGDRYLLRLGLWREWRAAINENRVRPALLHRIGRAARRVGPWRATSCMMVGAPLLAILLATGYLAQQRTVPYPHCVGQAADLACFVHYPLFASSGDTEEVDVLIANKGHAAVAVRAQITTLRGADDTAGNAQSGVLHPGAARTLTVHFITEAPAGWTLFRPSHVVLALTVTARGTVTRRWSIEVAPIPRLQLIRQVAGFVLIVLLIPFLIPLGVEYVMRRRETRGSLAGADAQREH